MPETRYVEVYTYPAGLSAAKRIPKNAKITYEPYEVTDEELVDEAERKEMENAEEAINSITTVAQSKAFLKKLVKSLHKTGALT